MKIFMDKEELELDLLLHAVYKLSGYDFRKYMRASIKRRVENRLRLERIANMTLLTERIIHDEHMLTKILSDFSINVTEMFRDPGFFQTFRKEVVPLLSGLPEIRIWHAGCSTGEEPYSMAILMEEEGLGAITSIYATDMNEKVLKKAESGIIPLHKMQAYTKNYMLAGGKKSFSEYYTADSEAAYLNKHLLDRIIFAQHNLVTDRSFNEFHVIICRNVLIYFNLELQGHVLNLFNASLTKKGFLGLGSKESIRTETEMFEPFNFKEKFYIKK